MWHIDRCNLARIGRMKWASKGCEMPDSKNTSDTPEGLRLCLLSHL